MEKEQLKAKKMTTQTIAKEAKQSNLNIPGEVQIECSQNDSSAFESNEQ